MDAKNNQKKEVADIILNNLDSGENAAEKLDKISQEIKENNNDDNETGKKIESLDAKALVAYFEKLLEKPVSEIRQATEVVKKLYYKKRDDQVESLRQSYLEEGGEPADFKIPADIAALDDKFKSLWKKYEDNKIKYEAERKKQLQENLEEKNKIIEQIIALTKKAETLNKTYNEYKALIKKWKELGNVPRDAYEDLMKRYAKANQLFYDYINLNKEFRDLDFKRNLQEKQTLIDRAEALRFEPDAVRAYRELQKLHRQWKEIGPVPKEKREEIWKRFSEISAEINKRHQEHYKKLKEVQRKNLEAKTKLCEAAEKIAVLELTTIKEWQEKTQIVLQLQQLWRKVGRVPRKYNDTIYERFRTACDTFFERKRAFFRQHDEVLQDNLKKKIAIAEKAEELKESTEWGKTAREFERLFKQWKEIGPVPRSESDKVWQRFRQARLEFFRRKRQYHKERRKEERENLKKKEELIEQIKQLQLSDNQEENIKLLEDLEKQWASIGYVPIKEKARIEKEFREAIDEKFASVNLDTDSRNQMRFEHRLQAILESKNPKPQIIKEIEKQTNELNKIKGEYLKLENNLSFFTNAPEEMVKQYKDEIAKLKEKITKIEANISRLRKEYKKLQ